MAAGGAWPISRCSAVDQIVGHLLDALAVPTTLTRVGVPESALDAVLHGILEEAPELGTPQRLRAVCAQMWRLE
jgi:hypothetical protein